jgi:DNA-binding response OmpR family regulator
MPPRTILVVEDEQHIVDVIDYVLVEAGFRVAVVMDGDAALAHVQSSPVDLVVLDLGLPGLSGWELFRAIRAARPTLPVIMLTSRAEEIDRVVGLELGADDYVTKPFSTRELSARVRAVLRRTAPGPGLEADEAETPAADAADAHPALTLDAAAFCATLAGQRMQLTRGEFRILEALVRHPARVYTREQLVARLYDGEHPVGERSIDAYIKRLRQKFAARASGCDPIATVHGLGYKLNAESEWGGASRVQV